MTDPRHRLEDLIQTLCTTGADNLDEVTLKDIKTVCRDNDDNCRYCYQILMTQLNKEHSEVRYSAFQIIDCLFQRSHVFREILLDDFQNFFELVLETDVDNPLPPPVKKATMLKKLAAKTIKNWHEKFADVYKLLDLGYNYLKNCKKVDFIQFSHQTSAQRTHLAQESERQQIFLNQKYLAYAQEMKDNSDEIKNCISQLERCIEILKPNDLFSNEDFQLPTTSGFSRPKEALIETELASTEANQSEESDDDDDFVEVETANRAEEEEIELRYLGFLNDQNSANTRNYELSVNVAGFKIDDENRIVVQIMRDLHKELKNSHLLKTQDWIKNFSLVRRGQDSLKEAIELKNLIQATMKKFDDLKLPSIEEKKSAEKSVDESRPGSSKKKCRVENEEETSEEWQAKRRRREEMLKIAPVLNLDEIEICRPVTQQVETEHRFYGRSDDISNKDFKLTGQQVKTTFVGKFEPVKWKCLAPLKNGKLCPRMDRFKCPLHGKIVARDATGQIVNESDKTVENTPEPVAPWMDQDLINDINAAAGKKLIETDKKRSRRKSKQSNLTDISKESPRKLLVNRLFTQKSLNKVGSILDSIEQRINSSKFHHQYNYSLSL